LKTYLQGVEVPLPDDERVLWQGSPNRNQLAVHAFHVRKIAIYFAGLVVVSAVLARGDANPMASFMASAPWLCAGGAIAALFAYVVAALSARTTLYAITERRVVMKIGIALPVVLNIPLNIIDNVEIKARPDGYGDLSLRLANKSRVAFAILWPHARAWRVRYPEPLLRGVPNIHVVGAALRQALVESLRLGEQQTALAPTVPRAEPERSIPVLITQ
jgi:hypothetical protein